MTSSVKSTTAQYYGYHAIENSILQFLDSIQQSEKGYPHDLPNPCPCLGPNNLIFAHQTTTFL